MMKRFIFSLTVLISFTVVAQDKITLEDIWVNYAYYPKGVDEIRSTKDGKSFTMITQEGTIAKFDFATGNKLETLYTPAANLTYNSYEITDNESKILIPTESEKIYRHSSAANYLLYDVKTKSTSPVSKGKQTYPSFAPVGNKLAFIKDNNIWIKDLSSGKETAITSDGKKNEIINGLPDWVYEEEFTMFQAYQWSPDGNKIVYMKFNEKDVPSFMMPLYKGGLYPTNDVFKYPKVGEKNSIVSLWVYDVQTGGTLPVELKNSFEYIPRFQWVDENRVAVFTMNRLQNELNINLCDIKSKTSSVILTEKSSTYIEISEIGRSTRLNSSH